MKSLFLFSLSLMLISNQVFAGWPSDNSCPSNTVNPPVGTVCTGADEAELNFTGRINLTLACNCVDPNGRKVDYYKGAKLKNLPLVDIDLSVADESSKFKYLHESTLEAEKSYRAGCQSQAESLGNGIQCETTIR